MKITKRDGHKENFDYSKIYSAVDKAFKACDMIMPDPFKGVLEKTFKEDNPRDDKGKLIFTPQSITAAIKQIPQLSKELKDAEQAIAKEIEEQGRARGGNESKSLMDDGILL